MTIIAGVVVPGSPLAIAATDLVRAASTDLLFHHSRRVFLFASLRARARALDHDPELLYVGAMFHDLGLLPDYRSPDRRFEVDGADHARAFLLAHGVPAARYVASTRGVTEGSSQAPPSATTRVARRMSSPRHGRRQGIRRRSPG